MYFNHQLHYSVSSTASSMREIVFLDWFVLFSFHRKFRRQFCWYGKRQKEKTYQNESCPTTFLRQSREFLAGMGATPHFLFLRQSFYFVFVKSCKILTYVKWIFKRTRQITCSRMELQRDMEEKYKRSILIRLDSTPNPGTLSCKGKEEGGERRRVT